MKTAFNLHLTWHLINNENGVSAIMTAVVLATLIAFTSFAVDVGYMYSTGNEIQNIADAAALAGARELGRIYSAMSYSSQANYDVEGSGDRGTVEAAATNVVDENIAAGDSIELSVEDISIGVWNWQDSSLTVTTTSPDAVQVTVRRDSEDGGNGPVTAFFCKYI